MKDTINLDELFGKIDKINTDGKINITLLKYLHRGQNKNFAISLPENLNSSFLTDICEYLSHFQNETSHDFDPVGNSDDETYEYIDLSKIQCQWTYIKQLIKDAESYKEKSDWASLATLSITKLSVSDLDCAYYLGRKQTPLDKLLKRHRVLMSTNDELEDKSNNKVFLFSCDVDFIIREESDGSGYVFILNRKLFYKIFNYDEEIKSKAEQDVAQVKNWKFLNSTDLIYSKINQKNVYRRLAKVFSDPVYLEEIEKTPAADLKRNLLERSDGNFKESDFDGDLIKLTNKNLDKVMKMIAKGFRYNFFANRAEES